MNDKHCIKFISHNLRELSSVGRNIVCELSLVGRNIAFYI